MNKKIIYSLVGLAVIFFIGSLIIFIKSNRELQHRESTVTEQESTSAAESRKEKEIRNLKVFFLTEESRFMKPLPLQLEVPPIKQQLYKKFVDQLLGGMQEERQKKHYIAPVPEGVELRSVFLVEQKQLLVLDFNDRLINQFPGGTSMELEFIYYIVNNICYNFSEIKMVKFMISGNEYQVLSGHIDIEHPFYPDYRNISDE